MAIWGDQDDPLSLSNLPKLSDYLTAPAAAPTSGAAPATGTGNPITSGLQSGFYSALAGVGSTGEAIGRGLGMTSAADAAAAFAARQRANERSVANPRYEQTPWSLGGMVYQVSQGLPQAGAAIGADVLGGPLAAAATLFPGMVGGNVEAAKDANGGQLSRGAALGSLGLAVPETALNTIVPHRLAGVMGRAVGEEGSNLAARMFKGAATSAAIQAPVAAATTALTQEMGDPNRSVGDRAAEIVDSALSGGFQGAVFGGAAHGLAHALARQPAAEVTNQDMSAAVDEAVQPPPAPAPAPVPQLEGPPEQARLPPPPTQLALPAPSVRDASGAIRLPDETGVVNAPEAPAPVEPVQGSTTPAPVAPSSSEPAVPPADQTVAAVEDVNQPTAPATWTPQEFDAAKMEVRKFIAGKKQPDELTPVQQAALHQEITEREDSDRGFKRVEPLAKRYGMLNDDNTVARPEQPNPPAAEATELGAQEAGQPVGAAPPRDAIPTAVQPEFDRLDRQKAVVAASRLPDENKAALTERIENAQTSLLDPKEADIRQARALADAVDEFNQGRQLPGDAPELTQTVHDRVEQAVRALGPDAPDESIHAALPDENPQAIDAALGDIRPSLVAQSTAGRVISDADLGKLASQVQAARKAVQALQTEGKINARGGSAEGRKAIFDQALEMHADRLDQVLDAVKQARAGDDSALQAIDPENHFNPLSNNINDDRNIHDATFDTVTKRTQDLLNDHADREQDIVDTLDRVYRPEVPRVAETGDASPHDRALQEIISQGATGRDVLDHLRTNGSNGYVRAFASFLKRTGVNPDVRLADPRRYTFDNDRVNDVGAKVTGSYNPALDRINIYEGSGMEGTILHEMAHAATQRAMQGNGPAAREAQRLFDAVKARSPGDDAYGLTNPREMIAEAFSNAPFQEFLKSQRVDTGSVIGDMWTAFKNMVARVLGLPEGMRNVFDQVMDLTNQLAREGGNAGAAVGLETPSVRPGTPQQANARLRDVARVLDRARATGSHMLSWIREMQPFLRKQILAWTNSDMIADTWRALVPQAKMLVDARRSGSVRSQNMAQVHRAAERAAWVLKAPDRALLNRLMGATQLGFDPRLTIDKQRQILNGVRDPQALTDAVAKANQDWNQFNRTPGNAKVYSDLHAASNAGLHANSVLAMRNVIQSLYADKLVTPALGTDWFHEFQFASPLHDSPEAASEFWKTASDAMSQDIKQYISDQTMRAAALRPTDALAAKEMMRDIQPLKSVLGTVEQHNALTSGPPNFHLGRDGKYFASAKLGEDPRAVEQLQAALDKAGFHDVLVQQAAESDKFYVRLHTQDDATNMERLLKSLPKGVLDPSEEIAAGSGESVKIHQGIAPGWMAKMIEAARNAYPEAPEDSSPAFVREYAEAREAAINAMTRSWMDMLPDNSINKVLIQRSNVQGASADMLRSFRKRALTMSRAAGTMSVAPEIGEHMANMKDQVHAINRDPRLTVSQRVGAAQAVQELMLREAQKNWTIPSPGMDTVRSLVHTLEVGSSPAYFLTLMTQVGSLSLPELAKTHGYVRSARALAHNMSDTFKIAKATLSGGEGLLSGKLNAGEGASFGLSHAALTKAGLRPELVNFIMHQSNRGDFDLGSYTHAMTPHHDMTTAWGRTKGWANTLGLYAEMIPRVLTALAARELYNESPEKAGSAYKGSDGFHRFVSDRVNNSQFSWDPANNPRATSKGGTFGSASPLINQFMGFKIKMIEKLYREASDAFGSRGPEQAAEARKFLAGHLAATTMLAGTLGVPFAAAFAGAYDKLADLFTGQDNHDVNATYRTFLSEAFGRDVGEMVARGLPRALGIDLSHLGDQNLLPGTRFLEDKRKFEDAWGDYLKDMGGSAVGLAGNDILGLRAISNGDYMDGLIKIVPELFKGPLEAVRLGMRGYVDKNGTKLPITAGAADVMKTAVGLKPANQGEYEEVHNTEEGARNLREARSTNISSHLQLALSRGDQSMLKTWEGRAMAFMRDHPGMSSPLMSLGETYGQNIQEGVLARTLNEPLGVAPNDIVGRRDTSYGNFR